MDPLDYTNSLQPSDFGEKLVERKESARHALRQTSSQELHELVRTLFPDGTHPWAAEFSKFIDEHRAESPVRGETSDGFVFVYYPQSNCGIWYKYFGELPAVGLLGPSNLRMISEIMAESSGSQTTGH
ncbi:MAG: hypothetical protein WAK31_24365 [Chthoniobacterales bacterium]